MATQLKQRKVRVSRAEIEKAREQILNSQEQTQTKKRHTTNEEAVSWGRDFWRGGIYCDSYGVAWGIDETLNTVRLGKTADVLEATKNVNRDNPGEVIKAVNDYQSVKNSQSYHSAIKKDATPTNGRGDKVNRIILNDDPQFLRLLDDFIDQGYGIPTIHSQLKAHEYNVPYATLGRWIKQRKTARQPCLL